MMIGQRNFALAAMLVLFCLAALVRIHLALRPGLWADEIFSLAMATGHSLEQPAAEANPAAGDFVEPAKAQPPAKFRYYLQHDTPPAGVERIIRAVFLSDTNPPLYYLLLNAWTRVTGTSDSALRLFSVLWALACFPLLWKLGEMVGGEKTAWIACILFSFSPPALYYSAEGRMYSLLWFLALSLALSSLLLARHGWRSDFLFTWTMIAAIGLLTHYFFAFVFLACTLWLVVHPGKLSSVRVVGMAVLAGLLVLPWYIHIPESLSHWRVTAGWLDYPLSWKQLITAPLLLGWSLLSGFGVWGGSKVPEYFLAGMYLVLGIYTLHRGFRRLLTTQLQLLWFWVLAACLGPWALDLLRHSNASLVARYALAGLPAGLFLAAMVISWLPRKFELATVCLILLAWVPGILAVHSMPCRSWEPYPAVGVRLAARAKPCDLLIVHSIPSGVIGVARYLTTNTPMASWVVELAQQHVQTDMSKLVTGCQEIALAKIHDLDKPSPVEQWLRSHTTFEGQDQLSTTAEILYFHHASPGHTPCFP